MIMITPLERNNDLLLRDRRRCGRAGRREDLAESGREVDCFEQTDRVGGHWNTDYDALHLITSRDVTGYEGFPMPADYPLFPSRDQVLAYLNAYADHFALRQYIRLTGIASVVRAATRVGRIGRLDRHDQRRPRAALRRRVRCQRPPARPAHPRCPRHLHRQADPLRLVRQHQRHRRRPRPRDQSGNSGCDIAVDAAQSLTTTICIRQGHYFQPKTFFGVPRAELAFLKEFSFEEQDLLTRLDPCPRDWENYPVCRPPTRTIAEGKPVVNDLLLYWIHHGRISVVPGLDRFEDRTVHFVDGTSREFDTIIWATGFHPSLPFLDPALLRTRRSPVADRRRVVPAGLDRLYLIGMAAPRGPQIMLYPIQSRLALAMVQLWEDGWVPWPPPSKPSRRSTTGST